ncbi:MAG: hypothetical protein C4530_22660 [Desulfobacteraceae bacterium]|nr:MAG: hypothetical protein C4530_22660 [Desulfobacteraceae bacterium]
MSELAVETIYRQISKLKDNEKKVLLTKLITEISLSGKVQQNLNIYDLKGVGKEVWNNIDAQEYVNSERASWE